MLRGGGGYGPLLKRAAFAAALLLGAGSAAPALAAFEDPVNPIYVDPVNGSDENDGLSWSTAMKTITNAVEKSNTSAYYNKRLGEITLAKGVYVLDDSLRLPAYTSIVGAPECDRSEVVLTATEGKVFDQYYGLLVFLNEGQTPTCPRRIANLTISNVTTTVSAPLCANASSYEHDGIFSKVVSNVVFTLCTRYNNSGNPGSAGMTMDGRTLVVDCLFSACTNKISYSSGVVICTKGGVIRDCRVENCSSYSLPMIYGRTVAASNVVEGCTFSNNVAQTSSSGVCVADVPFVRDCLFVGNTNLSANASVGRWNDDAGGVFTNTPPRVTGCTFLNNYSDGVAWGGAVLQFANGGTVSNCTFSGNVTKADCAGVLNALEVVDCAFTNNSLTQYGTRRDAAALVFRDGNAAYARQTPRVARCSFVGNKGKWGVVNASCPVEIEDCVFEGNSSSIGGGVIEMVGDAAGTVRGCVFRGNSAVQGGAIRAIDPATATISDCVFEGNVAHYGGAVEWEALSGTISDCVFRDNGVHDLYGGAAIYATIANETAAASLTVRNCLFEGNVSSNNNSTTLGTVAVLMSDVAPIFVESCTVVSNRTTGSSQPAIYCADTSKTGIGKTYVTNTVVALNYKNGGTTDYTQAISSKSGFTSEMASRIGYSYLHPKTAAEDGWWTEASHVNDSDDAPGFKPGTWIPSATSLLRDAGVFQAWMTGAFDLQRDDDGKAFATRFHGAAPDVGAFERVPTGGFTVIVR